MPADLDDERQGLIALQRITGFMHGLPETGYRSGPVPEVSGQGDGARMLAATLCYELLRDGEDRERAVELARFALAGDRLVAVDTGLLWIVAANVLLLADEDLGDFWDRVLARAYATGGLFAVLSVNLWRGFNQWRHGQLDDALQSLTDATEQQRMWGISDVTATYAAAFTLGVLVDRGDLAAAEAALGEARDLPWVGEGGRLMRESAARLLLELGRAEEALAELTAPVDYPQVRNPAWAPWRGLKAQALAATGRKDEALALADEEVALLRQWGAPSALGVVAADPRRAARGRGRRRPARGRGPAHRHPRVVGGGPRPGGARPRAGGRGRRGGAAAGGGAARGPRLWCARRRRGRGRGAGAAGSPGGRRGRRPHRVDQPAAAGDRADRGRAGRPRGRAAAVPHPGHGPGRARVHDGRRAVTGRGRRRARPAQVGLKSSVAGSDAPIVEDRR